CAGAARVRVGSALRHLNDEGGRGNGAVHSGQQNQDSLVRRSLMSRLLALQWLAAAALCSAVVGLYAGSRAPQSEVNPARTTVSARAATPAPPVRVPGAIALFSGKPEELRNNWMRRSGNHPAAWKITDGA